MRWRRVKMKGAGCYYHVMNRAHTEFEHDVMGDLEKQKFLRFMWHLTKLYTVEVLSYAVMDNHFHIIVYAPAEPPSASEAAARMNHYYGSTRAEFYPQMPYVQEVAERLNDISWFMHDLDQRFSEWLLPRRGPGARGPFWRDRFKSVILADHNSLWICTKYVALNPVRAGITDSPDDYKYSSWGVWRRTGHHPNAQVFFEHMRKTFPYAYSGMSQRDMKRLMRDDVARTIGNERQDRINRAKQSKRMDGQPQALPAETPQMTLTESVPSLTFGVIVGAGERVRELAALLLGEEKTAGRIPNDIGLTDTGPGDDAGPDDAPLASFVRPRI